MAIAVGAQVKTSQSVDANSGVHLASWVKNTVYTVIKINPKNGLYAIGLKGVVTCWSKESSLTVVGSSKSTTTPKVDPTTPSISDVSKKAGAIDEGLQKLLDDGSNEVLKYNMRLFGIPHQFTQYCDYRTYSHRSKKTKPECVGRKFIENIMLEAPVVTIVPGKPSYLPAAKNKQGTSQMLLSAANGSFDSINDIWADIAKNEKVNAAEKLRYYDFTQDYYTYMKYVNIMCGVAAAFLDLNNITINGVKLTKFDWKCYRWNADTYSTATGNIIRATGEAVKGFVQKMMSFTKDAITKVFSTLSGSSTSSTASTKDSIPAVEEKGGDKSLLESIESLLTQVNFVQFYVDSSSGVSESADNTVADSKLASVFDSGQELLREVAFIANSGGVEAEGYQDYVNEGIDALNSKLTSSGGSISGIMSRFLSASSNIVAGDKMILPQIYQNSNFSKSYSITVDLISPYGNKLSYYLNVLVPLFHLMALAVPKQTTANTYGAPFLVKAFYPGVFTCNLGIVQSLSIDKNATGDSWTVDGFPNHVRCTLNIIDLYADLSMSPAGDVALFVSNSSLIEYLATSCGVNLTVPQLGNRVKILTTAIQQAGAIFDDEVANTVFGKLENTIASFTWVSF